MSHLRALLSVLLVVASQVCVGHAHITFSINTGVAGASLLTAFKVPHGCDLFNTGDVSPKIPTLGLTVYLPPTLVSPLPGYVPGWPITFGNSTDPISQLPSSTVTWTATDGVGLPLQQFLTFPFQLTLPALTNGSTNSTLKIAALQRCQNLSTFVRGPLRTPLPLQPSLARVLIGAWHPWGLCCAALRCSGTTPRRPPCTRLRTSSSPLRSLRRPR